MVRAAEASGRATASCFEPRWTPERLPVWDLARQGFFGTPYFSRMAQSAGYWRPTHRPQSAWRYDVDRGGYLAGMLSHDIDWVCAMFGDPVDVCADVHTTVPKVTLADGTVMDVTADDTTTLIMRLASGPARRSAPRWSARTRTATVSRSSVQRSRPGRRWLTSGRAAGRRRCG